MADAPTDTTPTYLESQQGGVTHYTCLVHDASMPGGVCSHDATDFELFQQHMNIRHAGRMIKAETAPAPGGIPNMAEGTPAQSPSVPVTQPTQGEPPPPQEVPADEGEDTPPSQEPA